MSYPFLPVNPCCTDVVLNSPCGCSSTLPNSSCGQSQCGTNVILSSNVLYNGPVLDCIIAEPCDTLNVILQKIDEIICNLLTQINTLNIQVTNITTQIININNDITNINNTLDVCCNVTTTTTTTTSPCTCTTYRLVGPSVNPGSVAYVPCGTDEVVIRIGTNIVQYVCVDNTYDVIRIGNVSFINLLDCCDTPTTTTTSSSSSTSTTSTSSTTTSTTTAAPCITWQWSSTGEQSSDLEYTNCNGLFTVIDQADITNSSGQICVYPDTSPAWNPAPTTGTHTLGTSSIPCVTTTTTTTTAAPTTTSTTTAAPTTTTTTTTIPCSKYTLETTGPIGSPGTNDWSAINCCTGLGVGGTIPYPGSIDVTCIIDSSLILGPNVVVTDSAPCDDILFEVESTCCNILQLEYVFLPHCTAIGDTVYAANGYCYRALGTSLGSPTITLGDSTIYNDCVDCVAAHPCLTTTTSSSTSSTTTTTTTICDNPNLIVNGTFDTNLSGWSQTIFNDWIWSSFNGGSANYVEQAEQGILYQDVLTPGVTYDISFDLWMNNPTCTDPLAFNVNVYAGDTVYGPFNILGNQTINLILTCTNTPRFGIQALDDCNLVLDTIFIDNVVVSEHCPQFTTSTTSSTSTSTTTSSSSTTTTTTTTLPPL